jgi:uncharacterized membrane protein
MVRGGAEPVDRFRNGSLEELTMTSLLATMIASTGGSLFLWSILSFVVWVVVLVWIYNIAKRKGRHAVGWLILGFFFSIIILVIVLLLPSKRTTETY